MECLNVDRKEETLSLSVPGSLDTDFKLVDGILGSPSYKEENPNCFPCKTGISYGNAAFLAMCMKVAYEKWKVVRGIVNGTWRNNDSTRMQPSFVAGFSFGDMEVSESGKFQHHSDPLRHHCPALFPPVSRNRMHTTF